MGFLLSMLDVKFLLIASWVDFNICFLSSNFYLPFRENISTTTNHVQKFCFNGTRFEHFYSSQEDIILDNQKTASTIIKGTCVHATFYPKCNIYHRFFFLCPLTYVKPLKTTTCLNGLKQWIFKRPSVSTSMNGHANGHVSRI